MTKVMTDSGGSFAYLNIRVPYDLKQKCRSYGINFSKLMESALEKELERIESQNKEE